MASTTATTIDAANSVISRVAHDKLGTDKREALWRIKASRCSRAVLITAYATNFALQPQPLASILESPDKHPITASVRHRQ